MNATNPNPAPMLRICDSSVQHSTTSIALPLRKPLIHLSYFVLFFLNKIAFEKFFFFWQSLGPLLYSDSTVNLNQHCHAGSTAAKNFSNVIVLGRTFAFHSTRALAGLF